MPKIIPYWKQKEAWLNINIAGVCVPLIILFSVYAVRSYRPDFHLWDQLVLASLGALAMSTVNIIANRLVN